MEHWRRMEPNVVSGKAAEHDLVGGGSSDIAVAQHDTLGSSGRAPGVEDLGAAIFVLWTYGHLEPIVVFDQCVPAAGVPTALCSPKGNPCCGSPGAAWWWPCS